MKIVNAFIDPILREAIAKKKSNEQEGLAANKGDGDEVKDDYTLLDHLIRHTEGLVISCYPTISKAISNRSDDIEG